MNRRPLVSFALVGLGGLIVVSIAFAAMPSVGGASGTVLAACKVLMLGFLVKRVHDGDVYTMQWSSMLILLFVAEGVVRATSDPQPSAAIGLLEALFAAVFFVAVLLILRPLKKAARPARR